MFKRLKEKLGIVDDSEWGFEYYGDKNKTKSENPLPKSEKKSTKNEMEELVLNNNFVAMTQAQYDEMDKSNLPHGRVIYITDTNRISII
jgi:hypothetical protein